MSEYLHGAYGRIQAVGMSFPEDSQSTIVYVGTAPVHTLALASGESYNVNKPILVNNMAEARKYFGYSEDWAKYTLCEAMYVHLQNKGVGPLVFINVLDPTKAGHKSATQVSNDLTPNNGVITIASAESIILETVVIKTKDSPPVTKIKGTDYDIIYNADKQQIVITELSSGSLGTSALAVSYYTINAAGVTNSDVIGATDGLGRNTGLYAVMNVYQVTGFIPSFLAAPGFSCVPEIHSVMYSISQKINGHWDAYMFVDLPLTDGSTTLNLDSAVTYKNANGYTRRNETVYFPMARGTDGRMYHISVLAAANFQELLIDQEGIPYQTASNTDCTIIENLYTGADDMGRIYDDNVINNKLNKNGICSAAYVGGRWAIWGAHSAQYDQTNGDQINVAETNIMMLYYISNDFQARRTLDVDTPMTKNDLITIVAEEQSRIDALVKTGALIYGAVYVNAEADARSDMMLGDYSFTFDVTTTQIAKSLTAIVNWTAAGFVTYFEGFTA